MPLSIQLKHSEALIFDNCDYGRRQKARSEYVMILLGRKILVDSKTPLEIDLILPIAEFIETDRSIATFVTCAWTNVFRENTSVDRTLDTMNAASVWRLAFSSSFD